MPKWIILERQKSVLEGRIFQSFLEGWQTKLECSFEAF